MSSHSYTHPILIGFLEVEGAVVNAVRKAE
jgi:hypothetical protein